MPGCNISAEKLDAFRLNDGDLLIAKTGGTIGKSYLVLKPPVGAVFASYLIRVVPVQDNFGSYLKVFADSPLYWDQLWAASAGTGQPNVNGKSLGALVVPLPPLQEQRRIVSKVGALMTLCEDLEEKLSRQRDHADRLAQAIFNAVVNGKTPDGKPTSVRDP